MANKKSAAKRAAKQLKKRYGKTIAIAILSIVLAIVIACAVVYFIFPKTWEQITTYVNSLFAQNDDDDTPVLERGDGELKVHMLDVGQGDCIYIQLPDGKDMVIDCANYNDDGDYESKVFEYLDAGITDGTIEYLMLTHCDSDHVYFMDELLEKYQVNKLFMPNVLAKPGTGSNTKKNLQDQIDELDTSRFTDPDTITSITYAEFFIAALTEPDCEIVLNMDDDDNTNNIVISESTYNLTFYSPTKGYYQNSNLNSAEKKNAISPIGILEYNGKKIMLTGDSNEINEPLVMTRTGKIDCDVLKVGHHGSETSTSNEFLEYYTFEYALISCNAKGNTFSHPRQATLDRLRNHNVTVYRTDNNGNIVVTVDKDGKLSFSTEKTFDKEENYIGLTGKTSTTSASNVLNQAIAAQFVCAKTDEWNLTPLTIAA